MFFPFVFVSNNSGLKFSNPNTNEHIHIFFALFTQLRATFFNFADCTLLSDKRLALSDHI